MLATLPFFMRKGTYGTSIKEKTIAISLDFSIGSGFEIDAFRSMLDNPIMFCNIWMQKDGGEMSLQDFCEIFDDRALVVFWKGINKT